MTPPPDPIARLAAIRAAITADADRAKDLIVDLVDLAIASTDRAALLEAAALALTTAMFERHPVDVIRAVRAWGKESATPPPAPNPTVTQLGCTVDASEVAAAWAALLAKLPPGHGLDLDAAIVWTAARVVPHAERDPLGVHKIRIRHGRRGPDLIAIADRYGSVFVIRKIIEAASLGKEP